MEVVKQVHLNMDFDFNSIKSSPSSPKRFGECVFSAPTSPTRMSEFYRDFDSFLLSTTTKPPSPPHNPSETTNNTPDDDDDFEDGDDDFAFDIMGGGQSKEVSLSAEELFDGGKIKPLKSQQEPISPFFLGKKKIKETLSPRKKKQTNSFEKSPDHQERGRGRSVIGHSSSRRNTRSLSPYRVSAYPWEEEEVGRGKNRLEQSPIHTNQSQTSISSSSEQNRPVEPNTSKSSSRKWRLRDFLLFRSASEGRVTDKDRLRKYSGLFRKSEDVKNSSFRSTDSSGSGVSSGSRKSKGHGVSAHELHYTTNKAASEDLRKKTFLPYKQGILGRFAFNPTVHTLSRR